MVHTRKCEQWGWFTGCQVKLEKLMNDVKVLVSENIIRLVVFVDKNGGGSIIDRCTLLGTPYTIFRLLVLIKVGDLMSGLIAKSEQP